MRAIAFMVVWSVTMLTSRAAPDAPMSFPGAQWGDASPQAAGMDGTRLRAAVEFLERNAGRDGAKELFIARNGRVAWQGPEVRKVHGVWSVTKSFTSTVLGRLIDDGKCRLETRAREHLPALAERYPEVTLRHFTTMTSGYRAVGDEPQGSYVHGPSRTPMVPDEPLFTPPGSGYAYWDSAMNQFGNVLTRIAGEPMESLFQRRIADPIGMDRTRWDWGDFGAVDGLVVNSGSGNQGRHVRTCATELARLGHLFLNRGRWDGKQRLSAAWVEAATRTQVPPSVPRKGPGAIEGPGTYGYNWWTNGIRPDGRREWPGAPPETFAALGHNNNAMFVVPVWRMVVVRLGLDEAPKITATTWGRFLELMGAAVHGGGMGAGDP